MTPADKFRYLVDEFADIKIMKYQVPEWNGLSLNRKACLYHLSEAAKYGRDILWMQNCRYNLEIRTALENILKNYTGEKDSEEYRRFLVYAKRVFFSNGIHHHYSEDKILPTCSRDYFRGLMKWSGTDEARASELTGLIYDKDRLAQRKYMGKGKDVLLSSASNYYDGVSRDEAWNFYRQMETPGDPHPLSYGLNSRLVKKDGKLTEEIYREDGKYGAAIHRIVECLEAAVPVAENDVQRKCIRLLIDYYRSGDLAVWNEYNIAWVEDTVSEIDFVNGFVETYGDPLGLKASWEAVVNIKNRKASERTATISRNAQWFEDHSPVDVAFRKKNVKGVSAKVITAVCLGGDCHPSSPIGINLPNADWIRKEHGSKSVTIENLTEAYDKAAQEAPRNMLSEFAWDEAEIEREKTYGSLTGNLHTDLHECLGHGSGQLLPGTAANSLGEYSATLEEARADLFALYFIADSKMCELQLLPDSEAYRTSYDSYIRNGIFTQFVRIEPGKKNTEAHMQNRLLISKWCYEQGREENVIEKKSRNGKTYFVIRDYKKLRGLFGRLLAEIQRIKSEGDYAAGKRLVEEYAVNIDPVLHAEVRERYRALDLKPYGGFINPDIVPVEENGEVVDYRLVYRDDFLQQMLEYGEKYRTL